MPTQNRIRGDDRRDSQHSLAPEDLAFAGQAAALMVVQQNPFPAECFLEDPILDAEVFHHGLLPAVEPTGESDEQELPGLEDEGQG
jgi:hypothetical protein